MVYVYDKYIPIASAMYKIVSCLYLIAPDMPNIHKNTLRSGIFVALLDVSKIIVNWWRHMTLGSFVNLNIGYRSVPVWHKAITWINVDVLRIGTLETNSIGTWIEI